jgi:hypothetical protein
MTTPLPFVNDSVGVDPEAILAWVRVILVKAVGMHAW